MRVFLLIAFACVTVQAGERRQIVNLEIPIQCVKAVTMIDCDLNYEPPKCAKVDLTYMPSSCPIIHIVKEK